MVELFPPRVAGVDEIRAADVNTLRDAVAAIQSGAAQIPLAGIEGALGEYEPLQNARAVWVNVLDYAHLVVDGDWAPAIQAAIAAARTPGGPSIVIFPGGTYLIKSSVRTFQGVTLRGVGTHNTSSQPGSAIDASGITTPDAPAIYTHVNDYLHHGGAEKLRIINAPGDGIEIRGGVGEDSIFDYLALYGNGRDGLSIAGPSTPVHLGRISVHGNGRAGVHLVGQMHTHVQVLYVAGDNNGDSLIWINGLDTTANVRILGWKAERWAGSTGHANVIRITNGNGGVVHLGMGRVHLGGGVTAGDAIVLNEETGGSSVAHVMWDAITLHDGSGTGGYTNVYNDTQNTKTLAVSGATRWIGYMWGVSQRMLNVRGVQSTTGALLEHVEIDGTLDHDGASIGFYGATPTTKKTVTGSKGDNAALTSLLSALSSLGLITDSSS